MSAASQKVIRLSDVQKRTANSAVSDKNLDDDEVKFLSDLRGLIWKKGGSVGGSWKVLAEKAKLNNRTIQKFANGETKRPQLFTIRRMCLAIDYVMTVKPRSKK